jgi:hypothetical protein
MMVGTNVNRPLMFHLACVVNSSHDREHPSYFPKKFDVGILDLMFMYIVYLLQILRGQEVLERNP